MFGWSCAPASRRQKVSHAMIFSFHGSEFSIKMPIISVYLILQIPTALNWILLKSGSRQCLTGPRNTTWLFHSAYPCHTEKGWARVSSSVEPQQLFHCFLIAWRDHFFLLSRGKPYFSPHTYCVSPNIVSTPLSVLLFLLGALHLISFMGLRFKIITSYYPTRAYLVARW